MDGRALLKAFARAAIIVGAAADMLYFALLGQTIALVMAPLNLVVVSMVLLLLFFEGRKPKLRMNKFEFYQSVAENEGLQIGMPTLQAVPEKDMDPETLYGPGGTMFWVFYVLNRLTYSFEMYVLDAMAQMDQSRDRLVDALRIELKYIPQKRQYERLKLAGRESIEEILARARELGVNETNASLLFAPKGKTQTKVQAAADKMGIAK